MGSFADRFFAQFEGTRDGRVVAVYRVAFFGGLALHFFPGLIRLDDAYAAAGLRIEEWNHLLYVHFPAMSRLVVRALASVTMLAVVAGIVGVRPRVAAVVSFAGLYAFASFNALPTQTLALVNAWAILLLWCILGGGAQRREPRLFARLALWQTLLVVFFSGVEKLLAGWPATNEMSVILSYPRGFMVRDWVAASPWLMRPWVGGALSWLTLVVELGAPVGLLFRRTRLVALVAYEAFFLGIIAMLEVPPLFYCMFAAGALLALDDDEVAANA